MQLISEWKDIQSILCIGAHVDDIEIGCGGTLLKLVQEAKADGRELKVHWFIATSNAERRSEAIMSAEKFLSAEHVARELTCLDFRDGYLPYDGAKIKDAFFSLRNSLGFNPDLIFTHRLEDRHQDHRTLAELTWNTFRQHLILEYEIPKYEGDLGQPNLFCELDETTAQRKVDLLMKSFPSQAGKGWFQPETFWSLLRLRGIESGGDTDFAEAFTLRKALV